MSQSRKATPRPETSADGGGEWQKSVSDFGARARDFARKEPAQAAGVAFFAGLVLTVLPVGRLLGGIVRLTFAVIRPVLLVLGVVKLCEEIEKRNNP